MANLADKTAKDLDYLTPPHLLAALRSYFGGPIPLDPANLPNNPTAACISFTPAEDGLTQDWRAVELWDRAGKIARKLEDGTWEPRTWGVFVNPPYGKELQGWLEKIGHEASGSMVGTASFLPIIALLPVNRYEQAYWQQNVADKANMVCWVRKRVAFIRPSTGQVAKGNPYPSALWGFNVDEVRFTRAFSHLGICVALRRGRGLEAEVVHVPAEQPVAAAVAVDSLTIALTPAQQTPADPAMEGFG